jgi:hypothetical protein
MTEFINGVSKECLLLILEEKIDKKQLLELLKNTIDNSIEAGKRNNRYFTPVWCANIEGVEINLLDLERAFIYVDMYHLSLSDID